MTFPSDMHTKVKKNSNINEDNRLQRQVLLLSEGSKLIFRSTVSLFISCNDTTVPKHNTQA